MAYEARKPIKTRLKPERCAAPASKTSREVQLDDPDNPEWTEEDFALARPGSEVLPREVIEAFAEARKARGRPRLTAPKLSVKLRLDPEVVAAYRATGRNWQTRMNADLLRLVLERQAEADATAEPGRR